MTGFPIEQNISMLAVIALAHLIAGVALGRWFRFGVLLLAFAVVLAESLIGDFRLGLAPWYASLIAGIVLVQLGYAIAGRLSPVNHAAQRPTDPPKSMHAPVHD
jgi:hypothetical protein